MACSHDTAWPLLGGQGNIDDYVLELPTGHYREVVDLVDKPAGTVVHSRVLPGTIDQHRRLLSRVGA